MDDTVEIFGGPYSLAGIMTRQDIVARDPELVRRFVAAIVKALRWMSEHTPEDIATVLPKTVTGSDLDRYVKIFWVNFTTSTPWTGILTQKAQTTC